MSIYTEKPRGVYTRINDDWIPVLHLLNLGEGDTVEIATRSEKAKLTRINGDWIPVATLIDSAGDPLAVGTHEYAWDQTVDQNAIGTGLLTANMLYLARAKREVSPRTISSIEFYKAVVGSNVNVGMWSWDGTTWTLMSSSGSTAVAAGTNSWQSVPLLAPQTKQAGLDYFYGLVTDEGVTGTFGRATGIGPLLFRGFVAASKANSFNIASSAASMVAADLASTVVLIGLRGV